MSVGSEFGDIASAFGEEIYNRTLTIIKNPKTMLSKVKSVQSTGSFENDFGVLQDNGKKLLFKFEYVFEDGIVLTANHKTTTSPFPEGSEVEYEITKEHAEHGKSGKVKKPDSGNYTQSNASNSKPMDDTRQLMICRQSSLNRAVEVLIHNATAVGDKTNDSTIDPLNIEILAERFTSWVMQPEKKEEVKPQSATSELMGESTELPSDDLPF